MWRLLEPAYAKRFRTVKFDLVGAGMSDLAAYDREKYSVLEGYADDVLEIIKEFGQGPAIFVGHSVSAMIGMLADIKEPGRIAVHVMICPSPCYINDGAYVGGFERKDIDSLLAIMDSNYLSWSSTMAPAIMGAPDRPELGAELSSSFCRTDSEIAKQFARVTFLSDNRAELSRLTTPTLVLQCTGDLLVPEGVGTYLSQVISQSTLKIIQNVGHCPHLSAPGASTQAINEFLSKQGFESVNASDGCLPESRALLDEAACGLAQTDASGLFRHVNATFCNWLGYSPDELVGKRTLQDLLTTGSVIFHQTHSMPLLQMQGSISEVRLQVLPKDGPPIPMVLNALRHHKHGVVLHELAVFAAQDREKYEQELIRSQKNLEAMVEHANQLQAQSKERALFAEQMMGIVSHDLRNPIMTILMSAELLGTDAMTPRQSEALGRILKAGDRANRLITDLLDLTQARLGKGLPVWPRPIDLHATILEAVEELSQAFPTRELRHVQQGANTCVADADRLAQMVGNLVSNAMAYGDPAGPVTVTSTTDDDFFSIAVHNQGTPIPEQMMGGIFQFMVRGSADMNASRSVGLGLFIVSEIAKAHGGAMTVVSTREAGTVFTAFFPNKKPLACDSG